MAIPAIPTNFNIQQGNGQVYLTWDIIAGATSYSIQRSTDGVTFSSLGTSVVNNYLDITSTENTLYYYQVASVNISGTSGYTAPQNIIPTLVGQISLGELRQRSKETADRVNSNFVTFTEWNFNINQSVKELYDLLITVYEDYFVAPRLLFQVDGINNFYDLPNGKNYSGAPAFYKLYGVDLGLDSSTNAFATLKKFDFIERNRYVFPQITSTFLGVFNLQYRLLGNQIEFIPTPSGGQTIGLWYFPRRNILLKDTDVLDGVSGWERYVIVRAAKYALDKEESPTDHLDSELLYLKSRIEASSMNRDAGQPDKISDTRNWGNRWGNGMGQDGGWGGY